MKYKITVCLDKVIEAKNKKEARKEALGLINGPRKEWSIDIEAYDPAKERNKVWIAHRIHSKLTEQINPTEYMHEFDKLGQVPEESTDLEYAEALLNFIQEDLVKLPTGDWNIEAMADLVIDSFKDQSDDGCTLEDCVHKVAYWPLRATYPKDADKVMLMVKEEVESRLK